VLELLEVMVFSKLNNLLLKGGEQVP